MKNEKGINQQKPVIIRAWICIGKTHLIKKHEKIIEFPSGDYKCILIDEQKAVENKKSTNEKFVKRVETTIQTDFEEFLKRSNEKIIFKPGEYLGDVLIRIGISK